MFDLAAQVVVDFFMSVMPESRWARRIWWGCWAAFLALAIVSFLWAIGVI